jgi:anti-sigma regulatory factor (Ser/Thr protein kinase)
MVAARAVEAGLAHDRAGDIALATSEVAANSVRHGGGGGTLRTWHTDDAFVCEVRDAGHIEDPLVGRSIPQPVANGQRGLWLVNQLCDLVQLRSLEDGVVVRLHTALPASRAA